MRWLTTAGTLVFTAWLAHQRKRDEIRETTKSWLSFLDKTRNTIYTYFLTTFFLTQNTASAAPAGTLQPSRSGSPL